MYMCTLFFFKQKTAYELRISDWRSDVCSSDLNRAEPYGVSSVGLPAPRQRVGAVDLGGPSIEEGGLEEALRRNLQVVGVSHLHVTDAEGALGCLDQSVHKIETLRLLATQPLEEAQDHKGGQALRWRRQVVDGRPESSK